MSKWDYKSFLGPSETAEEREERRLREREEREARERDALDRELEESRQQYERERLAREEKDLKDMMRMEKDSQIVEDQLQRHSQREEKELKSHLELQQQEWRRLRIMQAEHDQQLKMEQMVLTDHQTALHIDKANRQQDRQDYAIREQSSNPLGLLHPNPPGWGPRNSLQNPSTEDAEQSDQPPPYNPPAYSANSPEKKIPEGFVPAGTKEQSKWFEAGAPVPKLQDIDALFTPQNPISVEGIWPEKRTWCGSCFDRIEPNKEKGLSGKACLKPGTRSNQMLHMECYLNKLAPHCHFCGITLFPHKDLNLSGHWGEYEGRKYHVECFQYEAGPRCDICFLIIFADPEKSIGGKWRKIGKSFIHEECWQEKALIAEQVRQQII